MDWPARRPLLFSSLVGVGAGVVLAAVWTAARPEADTVAAVTSTTKPEPPSASRDEIDATVDELLGFIADARGLEARRSVRVEVDSQGVVLDVAGLGFEADTLRALGMADPGSNVRREVEGTLTEGVLASYDAGDDTLFVRAMEVTPFLKMTLAHELVHALQDQYYELDDLLATGGAAARALAEGDAQRVAAQCVAGFSLQEQSALRREAVGFLGSALDASEGPEGTPRPAREVGVVEALLGFPFVHGNSFVESLLEGVDEGDFTPLDEAFAEPPVSTEQVLHPEAYARGDEPIAVEAPVPEGELVDEGSLGEFALRYLLDPTLAGEDAVKAAEGWGGDAYVTWKADGRITTAVRFVMDSGRDRDELVEALTAWTGRHGDAEVVEEGREVVMKARATASPAGAAPTRSRRRPAG